MKTPSRGITTSLLVVLLVVPLDAGILKGSHRDDSGVETLLAVGLLAKALSDVESPPECPPPIHVTKVVHVPVHTESTKVIWLKDKDCEAHQFHGGEIPWKLEVPNTDNLIHHGMKGSY